MGVNGDSYGHASGERMDVECDRKWVCGVVMRENRWRGKYEGDETWVWSCDSMR